MRSNFRANERRGSSLTIPNAAESQEHLIPRFREEIEKDLFARHPNENPEKNPKLNSFNSFNQCLTIKKELLCQ